LDRVDTPIAFFSETCRWTSHRASDFDQRLSTSWSAPRDISRSLTLTTATTDTVTTTLPQQLVPAPPGCAPPRQTLRAELPVSCEIGAPQRGGTDGAATKIKLADSRQVLFLSIYLSLGIFRPHRRAVTSVSTTVCHHRNCARVFSRRPA
jgi:hypothetical protein